MTRAENSLDMRWKRPALADLNYFEMSDKLDEIVCACQEIHWAASDDDTLIELLDGDEEEAYEFKMQFAELEAEAAQLNDLFYENCRISDEPDRDFDDCLTALIGDRFQVVGYDNVQENYSALGGYQERAAYSEAGKRLMRKTKKEIIAEVGRALGIVLSFQNVQMKYEYLKASFAILKDETHSVLETIKDFEEAYEQAAADDFRFYEASTKRLDRIIEQLSVSMDKLWVE